MAAKTKIAALIFVVLGTAWSLYPSAFTLYVMKTTTPSAFDSERVLNARVVQKYFLKRDLYIPIDHIISPKSLDPKDFEIMRSACPENAILWIWTPLAIRMSFFGSFAKQVCFGLRME